MADNIRFGRPDATRAQVEAAARAIGADPVILALPEGYDTEVGERGALLSAGERQLVAFARAWLADPALLILDEATSNLDVATETRVTEAMRRLRQGRTTIVIVHRLSTVIEADQIAVIQDGRVVEVGPPEELLDAGASGFMLKDAPPEEIAAAVRIVASGEGLLAPAVTRAVIEEFAKRSPAPPSMPPRAVAELTAREREILELLVRGLSNPEICQRLVISEATAKTHVAHILQKLHLRDRVQAVIYAYETGLVAPGSTH